ncbi:MAG: hypothetical protein J7556_09365 [Acidovorax sp.]|nr:hypothetical protein [Acidovorax sp.]
MKSAILATALALATISGNAELVNISANTTNTSTRSAIACTVVDRGTVVTNDTSGMVILFVFAEGSGTSDPDLKVWSLNYNYTITNNNWREGIFISTNGGTPQYLSLGNGSVYTALRPPYRDKDAAVMTLARPGETFCVESRDRSGMGDVPMPVNISITDLNAIMYKSFALKNHSAPEIDPAQLKDLASQIEQHIGQ